MSWNDKALKETNKKSRHAPRERVSWNFMLKFAFTPIECHAPRERVSWNSCFVICSILYDVTLHVSVWVEMKWKTLRKQWKRVTLHVSVWVEICYHITHKLLCVSHAPRERVSWNVNSCTVFSFPAVSRSTWACELKLAIIVLTRLTKCHAPRERVSWNDDEGNETDEVVRHAPRERVSWNL